jgi:hypothetical protein
LLYPIIGLSQEKPADVQANVIRFIDDDWADSTSSSRMVDSIFDNYSGSDGWRIDTNGASDCLEDAPAALESCLSTNGATATVSVDDNVIPAATATTYTALGAGWNTITVAGTPWKAGEWLNATVKITSGAGAVRTRRVAINTENQITVSTDWSSNPGIGDSFELTHLNDSFGYCLNRPGFSGDSVS